MIDPFPGERVLTDEDLAGLARRGSDMAFAVLLRRYEGRLRSLVASLGPRRSQREDLLQEARLGFLQAVREWDPDTAFAAHARRRALGAVRLALRQVRQDAVEHAVPLDHPVSMASDPDLPPDERVLPLLEILSVLGTEAVVLARCAVRRRLRR